MRIAIVMLSALALATPAATQVDEIVTVPQAVLSAVADTFPEQSRSPAADLASRVTPTLEVLAPCEVSMLFIWEGAGYRNSLGYFTFTDGPGGVTVNGADLLFPDVTRPPQGSLQPGSRVWLKNSSGARRQFQAGDKIGFFLIADGWNSASAITQNWTFGQPGVPADNPTGNNALGRGCFTSLPEINPDNAGHIGLVKMAGIAGFLGGRDFYLMGFEDLHRGTNSDDDFNDCVFAFEASPANAIQLNVTSYVSGDPDGDGVAGARDLFPNDANRAFVTSQPSRGFYVIAFEDLYPETTDSDFNDAVFAFAYQVVTNSRNRVTDVLGDYHLIARGASYDHAFGVCLRRLPNNISGRVKLQRFASGDTTPTPIETRDLATVVADLNRIRNIFASTRAALPSPHPNTPFANTEPAVYGMVPVASARILVEFDVPIRLRNLGAPPYDLYLDVAIPAVGNADIHMPGIPAFPDRAPGLPAEKGNKAFLDKNGSPWALLVPTSWRYPLEGVPVRIAYPEFEAWRDSKGKTNKQWYLNPTTQPDKVSQPIGGLIPARAWTLLPPATGL